MQQTFVHEGSIIPKKCHEIPQNSELLHLSPTNKFRRAKY